LQTCMVPYTFVPYYYVSRRPLSSFYLSNIRAIPKTTIVPPFSPDADWLPLVASSAIDFSTGLQVQRKMPTLRRNFSTQLRLVSQKRNQVFLPDDLPENLPVNMVPALLAGGASGIGSGYFNYALMKQQMEMFQQGQANQMQMFGMGLEWDKEKTALTHKKQTEMQESTHQMEAFSTANSARANSLFGHGMLSRTGSTRSVQSNNSAMDYVNSFSPSPTEAINNTSFAKSFSTPDITHRAVGNASFREPSGLAAWMSSNRMAAGAQPNSVMIRRIESGQYH